MTVTKENVIALPRRQPISTILGATAVVAVWMFFTPLANTPARADLIIQALDSTAHPGGSGSFDVIVKDTGGTFQVAGFSVELSLPMGSGISFTDVTTSTLAAPYLFGTLQLPPFTFNSFPTQDVLAGDITVTPPGFITLNPGDMYGLAHVTYAVDPSSPAGKVAVSLVSAGTSLLDNNGRPATFTASDGTITVSGTTVPEPSSLALTFSALLVGLGYCWRKRRCAAA